MLICKCLEQAARGLRADVLGDLPELVVELRAEAELEGTRGVPGGEANRKNDLDQLQTLRGSFSAVTTPIDASKYLMENS